MPIKDRVAAGSDFEYAIGTPADAGIESAQNGVKIEKMTEGTPA